jgi:hypothetical protein
MEVGVAVEVFVICKLFATAVPVSPAEIVGGSAALSPGRMTKAYTANPTKAASIAAPKMAATARKLRLPERRGGGEACWVRSKSLSFSIGSVEDYKC